MISYDLNKPGQDYEELIAAIKDYGTWAKLLKSAWLIYTTSNSQGIYNNLSKYLDKNDTIFINLVTSDYFGYFDKEVIEWMKNKV